MFDIALYKLQYEILNRSFEDLAAEAGVPVRVFMNDVKGEWKQWWPDPDISIDPSLADKEPGYTTLSEEEQVAQDQDELFASQAENFLSRAKRRLAVYNMAKEILLARRYAALEAAIIQKAQDAIDTFTLDPKSIQSLSTLYKNMKHNSVTSALQSLSFTEDENGLPTVIIRDLSGRGDK